MHIHLFMHSFNKTLAELGTEHTEIKTVMESLIQCQYERCSGSRKAKYLTLLGVREDLLDEIFGLYWLIRNIT